MQKLPGTMLSLNISTECHLCSLHSTFSESENISFFPCHAPSAELYPIYLTQSTSFSSFCSLSKTHLVDTSYYLAWTKASFSEVKETG